MEGPENIPNFDGAREAARERGKLLCRFLLNQTEVSEYPADSLENIGHNLMGREWWPARYNGSWALAQAAMQAPDQEHALELLNEAKSGLQLAEATARNAKEAIRSRFVQCYIPTLKETVRGTEVNKDALVRRLQGLNTAILGVRNTNNPRFLGIVTEVNVATLLTLHSRDADLPCVPWLSQPWQDSHMGEEWAKFNTDLYFSRSLKDLSNPIQVKRRIGKHRLDTEDLQKGYHPGMTMIFGDVHLGDTDEDPLYATRMLVKADSPERRQALHVMTANIVDELEATRQRVYGDREVATAA